MKLYSCLASVLLLPTLAANADTLFSENFDSLANGTTITTANSSLTYARAGTGTGSSLTALNPGNLTDTSALLVAKSGSLTGVGALNGTYTSFDTGSLSFSVHTPSSMAAGVNDLYWFLGSGNTTFGGNSTFSGNDLTAGFSIFSGQLQTRSSANAWVNVGSPLSTSTSYDITVVFNGSASSLTYDLGSAAPGTADLWVDGTLVGDDVSIRDAQSVTAFRIYTIGNSSATGYEVDNIQLTSIAVPEPTAAALGALGLLVCGLRRRKA